MHKGASNVVAIAPTRAQALIVRALSEAHRAAMRGCPAQAAAAYARAVELQRADAVPFRLTDRVV